MSVIINISDLSMSGNSKLLNDAKIHADSDVQIELSHLELMDYAEFLNGFDAETISTDIKKRISSMDKNSSEYKEIQNLFCSSKMNLDKLKRHIAKFSEGVVAQVLANYISRFISC